MIFSLRITNDHAVVSILLAMIFKKTKGNYQEIGVMKKVQLMAEHEK